MRKFYVETLAKVLKEAEVYTVPPELIPIIKFTSEEQFRKMIRTNTPISLEYDEGRMFNVTFTDLNETEENWWNRYFFNDNDLEQKQYASDYEPFSIDEVLIDENNEYRMMFGKFYAYLLIIANICGISNMPIRKDSQPNGKYIDFNMYGNMVRMCIQEIAIYRAII